jgi:hypothetical protein
MKTMMRETIYEAEITTTVRYTNTKDGSSSLHVVKKIMKIPEVYIDREDLYRSVLLK